MAARSSDHDLLIRLDVKLDALIKQVSAVTSDHERRLRRLEKWGFMAMGAFAVIDAAVHYLSH